MQNMVEVDLSKLFSQEITVMIVSEGSQDLTKSVRWAIFPLLYSLGNKPLKVCDTLQREKSLLQNFEDWSIPAVYQSLDKTLIYFIDSNPETTINKLLGPKIVLPS